MEVVFMFGCALDNLFNAVGRSRKDSFLLNFPWQSILKSFLEELLILAKLLASGHLPFLFAHHSSTSYLPTLELTSPWFWCHVPSGSGSWITCLHYNDLVEERCAGHTHRHTHKPHRFLGPTESKFLGRVPQGPLVFVKQPRTCLCTLKLETHCIKQLQTPTRHLALSCWTFPI